MGNSKVPETDTAHSDPVDQNRDGGGVFQGRAKLRAILLSGAVLLGAPASFAKGKVEGIRVSKPNRDGQSQKAEKVGLPKTRVPSSEPKR